MMQYRFQIVLNVSASGPSNIFPPVCIDATPTNMVRGTYLITSTDRTFTCGFGVRGS